MSKTAFIFPGQGSQYPDMLAQVAMAFPEVRETLHAAERVLADRLDHPLGRFIYPPSPFTPDDPVCSAKGALVTNIAYIPAALTAVMRENGAGPDFAPEGSLALKPWFRSSNGIAMPPELDLPVVAALPPTAASLAGFFSLHLKEASG